MRCRTTDEVGAQQQRPSFAGEVFAHLADVVGSYGRQEDGLLPQSGQQAVPVDRREPEAEQVESRTQHEPARVEMTLPELRPAEVAHKLPADRDQDGQGQNRLQERPPLPQPCPHRLCIVHQGQVARLPRSRIGYTMVPGGRTYGLRFASALVPRVTLGTRGEPWERERTRNVNNAPIEVIPCLSFAAFPPCWRPL